MAPLFRRLSTVCCFFCRSPVPSPENLRNFQCPACGCWNRYNNKGEIISDEPAMHEEHMNRANFAKRASPSKHQLPNIHGPGPFCHNCQTNQMLLMNLLSNYLPAPESPEYEQRLRQLPMYKESLYLRYPPVCENCEPAVEEEIYNKDQMARRKALNGFLKDGKARQRRTSVGRPSSMKENMIVKGLYWRIRGALWLASALLSIGSLVFELRGHSTISQLHWSVLQSLPFLILASLLWSAWDPTYLVAHKAHLQGRDVRIQGKHNYIVCQMLAWASRLAFSISVVSNRKRINASSSNPPYFYLYAGLAVELLALLAYPIFMRVQHPPPIRLIDTNAHLGHISNTRSNTPASASSINSTPVTTTFPKLSEHDLLASLSLSSRPVLTPPPIPSNPSKPKPVFGMTGFGAGPSVLGSRATAPPSFELDVKREEDDAMDAMDWSPTTQQETPGKLRAHASEDDSWLKPQRFFAPEKPTGLESILARTLRLDDDMMQVDSQEPSHTWGIFKNWRQWYIPVLFTVLAMVTASCAFWLLRLRSPSPPLSSFQYEGQSVPNLLFDELLDTYDEL